MLLVYAGCNPYLTKRINLLSKKEKGDSVYVFYPIVEAKRESNAANFKDPETIVFQMADSLTKKALHQQLDGRLPARFAGFDSGQYVKVKKILDSMLLKFMNSKVKHVTVHQDLKLPSNFNLILIPYYIWTRSTEDYDQGKCSPGGGKNYGFKWCTWTASDTHLIMINCKKQEVIFFKFNGWRIDTLYLPSEYRIARNFRHCTKPLLRKLETITSTKK